MEIHQFAHRILTSADLETKLSPAPTDLEDRTPSGSPCPSWPARSPELEIVPGKQVRVPPVSGFPDRPQRERIIHALANHELQAVELFAWALLAFPEAPSEFRRGLLKILDDEQRHTRMYRACLERLGRKLGEFPVTGYFWNKVSDLTTPARFVCAMSLTFENANLDHTTENARAAREIGDERLATVIEQVHVDEIEHVRFGRTWLERFKPEGVSLWEAYREALAPPLRPGLARGRSFHPEGRERAGLDREFIEGLRESIPGMEAGHESPRGRETP